MRPTAQASLKPKLVPVFQATCAEEENPPHPIWLMGRVKPFITLKVSAMASAEKGDSFSSTLAS